MKLVNKKKVVKCSPEFQLSKGTVTPDLNLFGGF
jgi:hypothetical protein